MKPRTCRCDCLQMHPNQLYESARAAAFLPGADGKCAEGGRGSSERCIYRIWGNSSVFGSGSKDSTQFRDFKANPGSLHFTATKLTPKACRLGPLWCQESMRGESAASFCFLACSAIKTKPQIAASTQKLHLHSPDSLL